MVQIDASLPISIFGFQAPLGLFLIVLIVCFLIVLVGFLVIFVSLRSRENDEARTLDALFRNVDQLQSGHAETVSRLQTMAEIFSTRQHETTIALNGRIDSMSQRLGQGLVDSVTHTGERLEALHSRLAVIDSARGHIATLAEEITHLRGILANKQSRGAFGQARLEMILEDGLSSNSYATQFTLSNKSRPDAVVFLPACDLKLVIDAKFPLESLTAFLDAPDDTQRKNAASAVRADLKRHIDDIAGKYIVSQETLDLAFMFLPSESLFAELQSSFPDVIQKAFRSRVSIVSPTLLMLALETVRLLTRDARMAEDARALQKEVGLLARDVQLVQETAQKLMVHMQHSTQDLDRLDMLTARLTKRGLKIEALDLNE